MMTQNLVSQLMVTTQTLKTRAKGTQLLIRTFSKADLSCQI